MNLYVVIPAYNEEKHILSVVNCVRKFVPADRIIVVDDGSKDKTFQQAVKSGATSLRHIVNMGKGAALKTGCDFAVKRGADAIIAMDSDGQHDPAEIPLFVKELENADIIFGYRRPNKEMPVILKAGNWFIGTTIKLLFQINIKDTQCGYRAFTKDTYKKIRWSASDYSVESEMIALTGKNRIKYKQKEIETIYLDKYKGTTVLDGIAIVLRMVWWKLTR